jgi:hypothetical protein
MGIFQCGDITLPIEDRALAHLQVVITGKLRRHEPLLLTHLKEEQGSRITVWVHPTQLVAFHYDQAAMLALNRHWVKQMTEHLERTEALELLDEPTDVAVERPRSQGARHVTPSR